MPPSPASRLAPGVWVQFQIPGVFQSADAHASVAGKAPMVSLLEGDSLSFKALTRMPPSPAFDKQVAAAWEAEFQSADAHASVAGLQRGGLEAGQAGFQSADAHASVAGFFRRIGGKDCFVRFQSADAHASVAGSCKFAALEITRLSRFKALTRMPPSPAVVGS